VAEVFATLFVQCTSPLLAFRAVPPVGPGGSYRGKTGRGNLGPSRWFMTHNVTSAPIIAALRKDYSRRIQKHGTRRRLALSAAPAFQLQGDKPRQQRCRIELTDDGLNVGKTARERMQRCDVAVADRR
jgi:hypothetical protein